MNTNLWLSAIGYWLSRRCFASLRPLLAIGFLFASVCFLYSATYEPSSTLPPKAVREFRAAWVATVGNIDWPSKPGLSTAQQKAELVAILDQAAKLKLNAVIFQVRPGCDALYASSLEPWSEYLTGTMGQPPKPFYDPLSFAVEEAHKRGLELHAWFNPYRARHTSAKSPVSANHISKTHPNLVRRYANNLWLDPGEKGVQDYSLSVVMDVVKRYDIDGVHFDDYFYPNEKDAAGKDLEFSDAASWERYGAASRLSREDWRRQNVNLFVQRVYASIKAAKPWVKFGISPFGIWRPQNPPQIRGMDAYAKLYADSRKWLAEGWVDYFAPQLYWSIAVPEQSFPVLLKWWEQQNDKGRHLWPGLNSYNVGSKWKPEEIVNQIRLTRKEPGAGGHIHWDMNRALMQNPALANALDRAVYTQPALVPASPWLGRDKLSKPILWVGWRAFGQKASWRCPGDPKVWLWLVQMRYGREWSSQVLPRQETSIALKRPLPDEIAVTPIDRCGNAGPSAALKHKVE